MKCFVKICSLFLAMSLILFSFPVSAADNNNATVYVSDVMAANDEITKVAVGLKNNPGITSFRFNIEYDSAVLELVDVENASFNDTTYGPLSSPFSIVWNDSIHDDNKTNGVICELSFKVKNGEEGKNYPIRINYKEDDVFNYNMENVKFDVVNGSITLPASKELGVYGDIDEDGEITANDALTILRASVGLDSIPSERFIIADVDEDGEITANDALSILRYSVGLIDSENCVGEKASA